MAKLSAHYMVNSFQSAARTLLNSGVEPIGRVGGKLWPIAVVVAAFTIGASIWLFTFQVVPSASDAEIRLSELRNLSLGEVLSGQTSSLDDIQRHVAEVKADLPAAASVMRWVGRFAPAFAWVPWAGQEMTAWARQMARAERDVDAASALLEASIKLQDIYHDSQTTLLASGSGPGIPLLNTKIQELETLFTISLDEVEDAATWSRSFGLGLQASRPRELTRVLGGLEDRMLTASQIGQEVSGLLADLMALAEGYQPLSGQFVVDGVQAEPWSVETLKASLARVNESALTARAKAHKITELIPQVGDVDWLESRLSTLDQVLSAVLLASEAASSGVSAVEAAVTQIEDPSGGLLRGGTGLLSIFDAFVARRDEINGAITNLGKARDILDDLEAEDDGVAFGTGLSEMSRLVEDLSSGLQLVNSLSPKGRALLAADGTQSYLVLGQSADELRATGGFVSAVWLVTFEKGELARVKYYDSVRVDDWNRLELYPKAPPGLEEHMNAWVWLLRDVSWDPDFPTTARSAADMYRLGQRQEVSGVIAINQWTLLRVIEALGSFSPPDGGDPVTPKTLLSFLEQGTDQHGRAYMDLVLQGVLDKIGQPLSVATLIRLSSALQDTLNRRDMVVFFGDPELQSIAGESGWDGRVRQGPTDYLYVVDSNVGWSKVDRSIQRDISYVVDLSRGPAPRASLTLGYSNHSGPGSPGCEPQWLFRSTDYSQLKNACYWNFFRVYMPQEARLLTSTPLPLAEHSVSVEIGKGAPGQETGGLSSSHNKLVFSGLVSLEAAQRKEVDLVYDLPASLIVQEGDRLRYELMVQKQPGVRQRRVNIDIVVPEGYRLESSSLPPVQPGASRVGFAFTLTQDTLFHVEFKKDTGGSG